MGPLDQYSILKYNLESPDQRVECEVELNKIFDLEQVSWLAKALPNESAIVLTPNNGADYTGFSGIERITLQQEHIGETQNIKLIRLEGAINDASRPSRDSAQISLMIGLRLVLGYFDEKKDVKYLQRKLGMYKTFTDELESLEFMFNRYKFDFNKNK